VTVAMKSNEARDDELPSIPKIDKTIHEPARLMIMAHLFVVESADFLFLQRQTGADMGQPILTSEQVGERRLCCDRERVRGQEATHCTPPD